MPFQLSMARIVPGNRFFYFLKIFTQSDDESQNLKLGMQDNSLVDYHAATFGVPLRTTFIIPTLLTTQHIHDITN